MELDKGDIVIEIFNGVLRYLGEVGEIHPKYGGYRYIRWSIAPDVENLYPKQIGIDEYTRVIKQADRYKHICDLYELLT